MSPAMKNRALFLDRDGVILQAPPRGEYLVSWNQCHLVDGITTLVKSARSAGYLVVVVTNQSQVARGMLSESDLQAMHEEMTRALDGQVDAIYYCPHRDEDGCECRKPKAGMLLRGGRELGVALDRSVMVGDSDRDVLAGSTAGCRTVFVRNAHNASEAARCAPDVVVNTLSEILPFL